MPASDNTSGSDVAVHLRSSRGFALLCSGLTVPTDATGGFEIGCLFIHRDGGAGTALYCNEGTEGSCDFDAVSVA